MDMNEVSKFEQKVGTLKLSAAMRIGAKLRPQTFGALSDDIGTCAMGAANEGRHGSYCYDGSPYATWPRLTPQILDEVIHRNNELRQPREQIADWLESKGY